MLLDPDCKVCRSAKVYEIDSALETGELSDVAALQFGFSPREVEFHIEHQEATAANVEPDSTSDTLLSILRRNAARLETRIKQAERDGDLTALVRSSGELTKNLALQNEIANRLSTDNASTETAQIRALARKMVSAVSTSPEMKDAIREALSARFGDDDYFEE